MKVGQLVVIVSWICLNYCHKYERILTMSHPKRVRNANEMLDNKEN